MVEPAHAHHRLWAEHGDDLTGKDWQWSHRGWDYSAALRAVNDKLLMRYTTSRYIPLETMLVDLDNGGWCEEWGAYDDYRHAARTAVSGFIATKVAKTYMGNVCKVQGCFAE